MIKVAWTEAYKHELPAGHRFPMEKYDLLPERLKQEGTLSSENFFAPSAIAEEHILAVHTEEYWQKLKQQNLTRKEERQTGFPVSPALVEREIVIGEGTRLAALSALENKLAFNIAGGTHHAYSDRGEGFCLLNDIAMASKYLLDYCDLHQILVVDLDVHQGNGTAEIFRNEKRVFTFSMHGANNYPLQKETSDLDIPLPDKADDKIYLDKLEERLPRLLDEVEPDFIFFQSGVDVLATDKLGRLGLTMEGCKQRDTFVFEMAKRDSIPVVAVMGGGYSEDIDTIVEAHSNTFRVGIELLSQS